MINIYDRIKEISYTIGTSNIALGGAVKGFSTFSSVYSNNDELFYAITDGTNYEIGSGVYVSSSNQIKRFPVKTTNSNNLVNFPEGLKEIYVNYPATNAVFNTSGLSAVPQNSGLPFWTSSNSLSYSNKFIVDSGNGRIGINKSNPTASIDIGGSSSASNIKASGFIVGNSGIYFPSGNNGLSSYSGGLQLTHFEMNQTDTYSASVIQLSGIVNQNILLKKQNAGTFFAGPPGNCSPPCNPAYPSFRPLIIEDIPDLSSLYGDYNIVLSGILNERIVSVSGTLNDRIVSVSGILNDRITSASSASNNTIVLASGALNNRIGSVSGYLDNKINVVSGVLQSQISMIQSSSTSDERRCEGRLSISSSDALAEGNSDNLYFVPYNGNTISLYDGSSWQTVSFGPTLVKNTYTLYPPGAPADPAGKVFDIFAYLSGANVAFETQAWTDTTNRAASLSIQDGIYVKSSNYTRRYIGSVMPISLGGYPPVGGNKFYNSNNYRYIYNYYNRITTLAKYRTSRTWTCNSSAWRQLLNTYIYLLNSITINVLCGIQDDTIFADVSVKCYSPLTSNSNYMLTINSSNFNINSIESPLYVSPTATKHTIDSLSADYNDNIEKQLYGSMTQIVPIGINTYYVAERVLSGKTTPNLTFDYTNGISATWRC
jgi:hypothetical protein